MPTQSELVRAVSTLVIAMSSSQLLSACTERAHAQVAAIAPERSTRDAGYDLQDLQHAAAVVRDWHRRDPAQTAQVLHDHGLFACDEATAACIAARAASQAPAQASAQPTPDAGARPASPIARPSRPSNPLA
jgi:hypothetical protein